MCVCALLCVSVCVLMCVWIARGRHGPSAGRGVCVCDAGYYPKLATSDCVWWTADIFSLWAAVWHGARGSALPAGPRE